MEAKAAKAGAYENDGGSLSKSSKSYLSGSDDVGDHPSLQIEDTKMLDFYGKWVWQKRKDELSDLNFRLSYLSPPPPIPSSLNFPTDISSHKSW
ncbi:hypothetical protein L1987_16073 [Smallanthus sonchifolius]|uniref:Uncharacterized protein n=1 Tax=Smallanthus sonchifolius TaxID=185202 RepID=A0ACB9J867_9ASTR|nr:hypothetical protein L1987_16073 [Smallanthus sonchifolius]